MIVSPDHGIIVSKDVLSSTSAKTNEDDRSPVLLVPENITIGTVLVRLLAQDKDTLDNAKITYKITNATIYPPYLDPSSSNSQPYFIVNPRSGALSVARSLPANRKIHLDVIAFDRDNRTDHVMVKMTIVDVNDHQPIFRKSWYTFNIPEGNYKHHKIGTILADDLDTNDNARINYTIDMKTFEMPNLIFEIGESNGVLMITGDIDRETQDNYQIIVIAKDNGLVPLSSSVEVEINVLDVNDNPPSFYGFVEQKPTTYGKSLPIYHASVAENTPIGTVINRVYANDTDFIGNGNGLILFDLERQLGMKQFFAIDNKDGAISTIAALDYERQELHNLTIIARDLGSPSLTSTAMLYIKILDVDEPQDEVPDKPVFQHRYYEVEVEENSLVPLDLVQLNVSDRYVGEKMKFAIVTEDNEVTERFQIDVDRGTVVLLKAVDREYRDKYEFKVKVDRMKMGRGMLEMIYPVDEERLGGLGINEAKIVIRIKDVNDNVPKFKSKGRPLLAAVPASVSYGYEIIRVEVSFLCIY